MLNKTVFKKEMKRIEDVYDKKFPLNTAKAWYDLFKDADDQDFQAGIEHLFRNANPGTVSPRFIFEGIEKSKTEREISWQ